ncbi:MAG TPA: S8 family serine peptidase [Chitinophagales bacterium]|nr:S8 family serine peptidase [Chitinophagales bacterium]
MKKPALLLFISALTVSLYAQNPSNLYYWVKFKNKDNDGFSINNPQQFLSQKSIDRRAFQNIAIDTGDLPITQAYIDSITPYTTRLVHRLKWFNMVVVEMDDSTKVDSVKRFSFVDSVAPIIYFPYKALHQQNKFEELTPVDQSITYPNSYGASYHQLNMLNVDLLHQLGYKGQGITIAMMDNGCMNVNRLSAFDSVRPRILGTWDFVHNQQDIYNDGGHGTNTFSCIAANMPGKYVGAATGADFYLFQSEDNEHEWAMEEYNWAAAAEMADSVGAQLFSTSLGYTTFDDDLGSNTYADLNGNKTVITQAANTAFSKGILVFNSAGNDGANLWHYISAPADGDSVIAVGAVDSTRAVAGFSSRGPNSAGRVKPDLCAQGGGVYVVNVFGNAGASAGTSFSCPILAGSAAALWSAFPNKTAQEIKDAIMISADHFWSPDSLHGYGIPNLYNAYLLLKTNYNSNELQLGTDVRVYPNPFSNELHIALYGTVGAKHSVEIFDMAGRCVCSKDFYIRDNTFEVLTFEEAGKLPDGEYVIRYDHNRDYTHPIMKMK